MQINTNINCIYTGRDPEINHGKDIGLMIVIQKTIASI